MQENSNDSLEADMKKQIDKMTIDYYNDNADSCGFLRWLSSIVDVSWLCISSTLNEVQVVSVNCFTKNQGIQRFNEHWMP
jgi:arginine utilization protein RocB